MELRRDLLLAIGTLIIINMAVAFGAIGLFTRMSPAIDRILARNVESIEAAGDLLNVLAITESGNPVPDKAKHRYEMALQRAAQNAVEPGEETLVNRIRDYSDGALSGNGRDTKRVVDAIEDLIRLNRAAMNREHAEARRLGLAGIWTVVFVATFSFAIGVVTIRRIRTRILDPIGELNDVLSAVNRGDPFRRCHVPETSAEVRNIFRLVNELLDRLAAKH